MTEKENFMRVIRGEVPAWVPRFTFGPDPFATHPLAAAQVRPGFLNGSRTPRGGVDIFGVEYVATAEMGGATLPAPGKFILEDIRKWRDVIKVPDISGIDWEAMAKKDMEALGVDRNQTAVILGTHVGYFQHLMNFMGFTEGLCAMSEEPEEVIALMEYLSDFYVAVSKKAVEYYKPDILTLTDDTATATNPFISPKLFREEIKPYHARLAQTGTDAGLPIMMHNCGRCEDFIPDWLDYNVSSWNPAQVINDLDGIKKKYGNNLVLIGCWDSSGPVGWSDAPEEVVRKAVRDTIDRYATGGGFIFLGSVYGPIGDKATDDKRRWMTTEYEAYREKPYK
ncbi:hypothetical protein FACS1894151_05750 [Spirochaetia bacterium]|nr:hypothetical protein FACS1894151_05750 [Spirochaetia bacterium]